MLIVKTPVILLLALSIASCNPPADQLHSNHRSTRDQTTRSAPRTYKESPDDLLAIEMVYIPDGTFVMGSPEGEAGHRSSESPQRTIKVDGFWMSRYEITRAQYDAWSLRWWYIRQASTDPERNGQSPEEKAGLTRPGSAYNDPGVSPGASLNDNCPRTAVTPWAAQEFCRWLTVRTRHLYRLPTEAEWEYAARAGSKSAWHFGNARDLLKDYAWYGGKEERVKPVGQKKPNAWGLYDMYGNAAEWVLDGWSDKHNALGVGKLTWIRRTNGNFGVTKGGSVNSSADQTRSASRVKQDVRGSLYEDASDYWNPVDDHDVGFRIVRSDGQKDDPRFAALPTVGVKPDPQELQSIPLRAPSRN